MRDGGYRSARKMALMLLLVAAPPWGAGIGCSFGRGGANYASLDASVDSGSDSGADSDSGQPVELDLVPYVDPFIGTDDSNSPHPVPGGAGGSTYPGAVVPFGMVQLGPDTPTASPSGYRYSDGQIDQFSVTHFDGAGCPNNEDIPFLPIVGELTQSPGTNWSSYRSSYARASEAAAPGYYGVVLDKYDIRAELTATTRTGFARYTFPATTSARVLVHTGRSATGTRDGSIEIISPNRIQGTVTAGGFCFSQTSFLIHFVIVFDRSFTDFGTWMGSAVSPGSSSATGTPTGGYVTFDTTADPNVQMKIGLSFVSIPNALGNLDAESPDWDFDAVRALAQARWNTALNRIQVEGGSTEDLVKLYTALYHVLQSPNVASDTTGEYMGFDGQVHTAGRITYQNYSGWDIIRSWTHLIAALSPQGPDIIASMVQDGVEGGLLPFWSHQNVETRVMVGDPGTVSVANAHAMGVRGFDADVALALMTRSADNPLWTNRWGLENWIDMHFAGNAAISLEYAMADFALAQMAQALGDTVSHEKYLARSDYWQESWNPDDGFIEPRVPGPGPGQDAARIYEFQVFGPASPATNLALGKTTTASASCSATEGPDKAINGTWTGGSSDKWCDNISTTKWWQVDLGAASTVDRFVIYHAGAGGESTAWNTQDFDILVSGDGTSFATAAAVIGNTDSISTHTFSPVSARYIRLEITTAIQQGAVGAWDCQPFDPAAECGFIEGNGAQYVWMVPHNQEGLFTRMGGHAAAVARLDDLFTELNAGTNRPYFYIGNEPQHGTPWAYNFARAPWRTQEVVRRIVDEEFNTTPGGLPGNDDLGATSAWLVWAYLGMYPMIPGTDILVLHGPRFPAATLCLANGNTLRIRAADAGASTPYVQALHVDGTPQSRSWLRFADISGGATLDYTMGPAASTTWGSDAQDVPPSFEP